MVPRARLVGAALWGAASAFAAAPARGQAPPPSGAPAPGAKPVDESPTPEVPLPADMPRPLPEAPPPAPALPPVDPERAYTPIPGALPGTLPPDPSDPTESPTRAYRFIGLRFRDVVVPKFMVNLFADGGSTVNVPMAGPEFTIRRDGLEYDLSIQYADYSMRRFLFKSKTDDDVAYEMVHSSLKMVYVTFDLLYDVPLDKKGRFSLLVGGGVGLAPVFGNLYRAQVYPNDPNDADPDRPSRWSYCAAPGDPPVTSAANGGTFCGTSNDHYGNYKEPSWTDGGGKPIVIPWISLPQLSFRYKPMRRLQTRADLGFSITGFFFGLSAGYGL
ncbi:MAG TPA: hypothetical protein VFS43_47770 [Polyangiaceae bacterium]|nr:hypothetical protein [Polyangiaceae bacterium]